MLRFIYKTIIITIAFIVSILFGFFLDKHIAVAEAPSVLDCSEITNDHKLYAECVINQKWDGQWTIFYNLIQHESGWNHNAVNPTSGACGLGQALPCSKVGDDWDDPYVNLDWTINYIEEKYGDPQTALIFHQCTGWCWYPQSNEYRNKENTWY